MAFSFYQSLRTVPTELTEAGRVFGLSAWARFWRIEVPFGMPQLIWNMMMSMSGAWFFVVAAEAFTRRQYVHRPAGHRLLHRHRHRAKNMTAIFWAILAMLVVILIYDQLLFRPLVAWADRFRIDVEPGDEASESWALSMFRRSKLMDAIGAPFETMMRWTYRLSPPARVGTRSGTSVVPPPCRRRHLVYLSDASWCSMSLWRVADFAAIPLGAGRIAEHLPARTSPR